MSVFFVKSVMVVILNVSNVSNGINVIMYSKMHALYVSPRPFSEILSHVSL